jgi:hypothetical protein
MSATFERAATAFVDDTTRVSLLEASVMDGD